VPADSSKITFLDSFRKKSYYNAVFFRVKNKVKEQGAAFWQQHTDSNTVLGINIDGLHILDPQDKKLQRSYPFCKIVQWKVQEKKYFWMEVEDPQEERRNLEFLFETPLAPLIEDTIVDLTNEVHKKKYTGR